MMNVSTVYDGSMANKLQAPKHEKVQRTERKYGREEHKAVSEISQAGQTLRPYGTQLVGYASVFYYKQGDQLFVVPFTGTSQLMESVCEVGIRELSKKCMREYGREPKED